MRPKSIRKCVVTCPVAFLWGEINNSWLQVKLPASAVTSSLSSIDSKEASPRSCPHNTFHNTWVCSSMTSMVPCPTSLIASSLLQNIDQNQHLFEIQELSKSTGLLVLARRLGIVPPTKPCSAFVMCRSALGQEQIGHKEWKQVKGSKWDCDQSLHRLYMLVNWNRPLLSIVWGQNTI